MGKTSSISVFFAWLGFIFKALYLKWQTRKKLDDFIKDKGKIRYSGTTTVHAEYPLPLTFKLREQTLNDENSISFYCEVTPDKFGELIWFDSDTVLVNNKYYTLARSPSRTTDPLVSPESPLIVRGEVFYPSWQERLKFTVKR